MIEQVVENRKVKKVVKPEIDYSRVTKFFHNLEYEAAMNCCGVSEVESVAHHWKVAFNSDKNLDKTTKKYIIDNFKELLHEAEFITKDIASDLSSSYWDDDEDIKYSKSNPKHKICSFHSIALVKSEATKELLDVLDKACLTKTTWRKNPNSGNLIKIWLI